MYNPFDLFCSLTILFQIKKSDSWKSVPEVRKNVTPVLLMFIDKATKEV